MIKRNTTGRGYHETDADGNIIGLFEQAVFIEYNSIGDIVAFHRIDYSVEWHLNGIIPVKVKYGSPNFIENLTVELTGGKLPSGVIDDSDLVDNYKFEPSDKSFTRK